MKIAFFEIKNWEIDYLKERIKDHELLFFEEEINEGHIGQIHDVDIISVFIYSEVKKEIIEKLPNLKLIATRSTGFDHIDLDYIKLLTKDQKKQSIIVSNVPFYGENTVAEHTFALILNLARNVHKSYLRTIQDNFSIMGLEGFDLKGKTLGVIGTGHIGLHVIKIAKGFGMDVIAFDPIEQKFVSEILGFRYTDFDTVISTADIVSLHAPYNKHTHHLINKDNIGQFKDGAIIINTSRGGLIETESLMQALESGKIGGAGLDVIEGEHMIKEEKELLHGKNNEEKLKTILQDHIIFKKENVVFTPHNAFNSKEAKQRILDTTIENIRAFTKGSVINNII